jgi:hypothetical protein
MVLNAPKSFTGVPVRSCSNPKGRSSIFERVPQDESHSFYLRHLSEHRVDYIGVPINPIRFEQIYLRLIGKI